MLLMSDSCQIGCSINVPMRPNSKCYQFYNLESFKEVEHTVVVSVLVVVGALLLAILLVGHGGSLGVNLLLRRILQRSAISIQEREGCQDQKHMDQSETSIQVT